MRQFDSLGPDAMSALSYAPTAVRDDFAALLLLDSALGNAVRAARDPVLGQIRLAWWREQFATLPSVSSAGDPALVAIGALLQRHDVKKGQLDRLVNGWEILLGDWPMSDAAMFEYAAMRGHALFGLAADCAKVATDADILKCGEYWALADLACHCSDESMVMMLRSMLPLRRPLLPKSLSPFAILTRFAFDDARRDRRGRISPGSPRRMLQALGTVYLRR